MNHAQWIWIIELYYGSVIGYYADEYSAEQAVKRHAAFTDGDPEDYNIFKVPLIRESAWQNIRIKA